MTDLKMNVYLVGAYPAFAEIASYLFSGILILKVNKLN